MYMEGQSGTSTEQLTNSFILATQVAELSYSASWMQLSNPGPPKGFDSVRMVITTSFALPFNS